MAKVQIFRGDRLEQEVPFGAHPVSLGRSSENDIVLDHTSISRKHATLAIEAGRLVLRDAGSTNGIYVDKQRVESWEAVEGQGAELGVFTVRVVELASAAPPEPQDEQRTRIITRAVAGPSAAVADEPPAPAVLVASGPDGSEKRYRLSGQPLTVGRGKECDVCFDDRMVSRLHARVYPDGGTWKISDMESVNGIFLNGVRVKEAVLSAGETVTIGSCTLALASGERRGESVSGLRVPVALRRAPSRKAMIAAGVVLVLVAGGLAAIALRNGGESSPSPGAAPGPQEARNAAVPPRYSPQPAAPAAAPSPMPIPQERVGGPSGQDTPSQEAVAPVVVPRIPRAPVASVAPRAEDAGLRAPTKPAPAERAAGEDKFKARQNVLSSAQRAAADGDCGTVRTSARAMDALDARGASPEARAVRKLLEACNAAESVRSLLAEAAAGERAGDWGKARAAYQQALALEPENVQAKRGIDSIAAAEGGRKSRIKDCFQKAEIFESIGELKDAVRLWQEVLSLAPDPADPDNRNAAAKIEKYKGIVR